MPRSAAPDTKANEQPAPYFFVAAVLMLVLQRLAKIWNGSFFGPGLYDELSLIGAVLAALSVLRRERVWLLSALLLVAYLFIVSLQFW